MFIAALAASASTAFAVNAYMLKAEAIVQESPPRITIQWDTQLTGYQVTVYRRLFGQQGATWGAALAVVNHPERTYVDTNVQPGVVYEYKLTRPYYDASHQAATAYICAGMNAPLKTERGTVLLVVEETMAPALAPEVDRLHLDLVGDGWTVVRRTFARHGTATPAALRAFIQTIHSNTPGGLTSVFLLGTLPRVQSGNTAPDGHASQPQDADVFYADMDGTWTDSDGNGVYDGNYLPGNQRVEVQLGRVDLAGLPAWPVNEQQLLRLYLNKDHAFRTGLLPVAPTNCYNSGYCNIEWSHAVALAGPSATVATGFDSAKTNVYLCGVDFYDWNGANYAYHRLKVHFSINFGSGKLYWRSSNNAMRGMLAQPTYGLTCAWGSRPNWYFHQMGMGETIGYCAYRTQNNHSSLGDYAPQCHYYFGGGVHVNLMGDPTLRLHTVLPPGTVHAALSGGNALVSWAASPDATVESYDVYRADVLTGSYARLNATPVAGTNYLDTFARTGTVYYMVKALKLERNNSGSYSNSSAGVFNMLTLAGAGNTTPAGQNGSATTPEDASAAISLSGSDGDGDSVGFGMVVQPEHGWLGGASNIWTYKPDANWNGTDTFVYMVYDIMASAIGGTVTVVVTPVNDIPVATNQAITCTQSVSKDIVLYASDVDKDALAYLITTPPTHGAVTGQTALVTYTPDFGYIGTDTFKFAATDGMSTSTAATVTLYVLPEPVRLMALVAALAICTLRTIVCLRA